MAYYLRMDGTRDLLITPTITFTKIEIDLYVEHTMGKAQTYFDARSNNLLAYLSRDVNNLEIWLILVLNVAVNGVAKLPSNNIIPSKTRQTVTINMLLPAKDSVTIFAKKNKTEHVKGRIYGARFYNNNTMVANYDMQTRTLQDQSGNGNHATAEGGTWATDMPSIVDAGILDGSAQTNATITGKRIANTQLSGRMDSNSYLIASKTIKDETTGSATGNGTLTINKIVRGETFGTTETNSTSIANRIIAGTMIGSGQPNATGTAVKTVVSNAMGESNADALVIPSRVVNGSKATEASATGEGTAVRIVKGEAIGIASTMGVGEAKTLFKGEGIGMAVSGSTVTGDIAYYTQVIKGEIIFIRKQIGEAKVIRKVSSEVKL